MCVTVKESIATCVLHVFHLLCLCQARQDILAQDLAEAIGSQVELAEQLRCYRGENEQLLREKQEVCGCLFSFCVAILMKRIWKVPFGAHHGNI